MMDNKLSKPVFEIEVSCGHWLNCTSGKLTPDASADFSDWPDGVNRLYSQEYVSTLLAELESKDKRIAELEGQLQSGFTPEALAQEERAESAEQRVDELEAKLATPVRLPEAYSALFRPHICSDYQSIQAFKVDEVIAALREHGFTVEWDA